MGPKSLTYLTPGLLLHRQDIVQQYKWGMKPLHTGSSATALQVDILWDTSAKSLHLSLKWQVSFTGGERI